MSVISSKRYRVGDAIVLAQQLQDGAWVATFCGFTSTGATESDVLAALAADVEGATKHLRTLAVEAADSGAALPAVIVRTHHAPTGDVRGQIVDAETGEVLHECGWQLMRKEALRDAEEVAQRKGYRVVEVSR